MQVSKDKKVKRARREIRGPLDPWVLRENRETRDCQVSMAAWGSLDVLGRKERQAQLENKALRELLAPVANLARRGRRGTSGPGVVQEWQAMRDSKVKRETADYQVFQGKKGQRETRAHKAA